jgi:hypothetical protein
MERDTIIFSGASHTFGLGLEWELDEELNSEKYLQKGIHIPIPRLPHYQNYWREYRWPTLVCNELGCTQYNVHDMENDIKIGGNSVETIWLLIKKEKQIKKLLSKTKYVILETPYIRWFDEKLHGGKDGHKYPNTIMEMIDLINNPNSDNEIVSKTLSWINDLNPEAYMFELYEKIKYLKTNYSEIKFLILPWHSNIDGINHSSALKENIIEIKENEKIYPNVNTFLEKNKIQVWNKAKAFNGNYKFNKIEDHASIEGHKRVANIVVNHIKNLENSKLTKTII